MPVRNVKKKREDKKNEREEKFSYLLFVLQYFFFFSNSQSVISVSRKDSSIYHSWKCANGAKRKRKMVCAIITATLLLSHRINIIRCIV